MSTAIPFNGSSAESATPSYRLFDSGAVAVATFFGSPLAGALLMAMNYRRLGKAGKAGLALLLGLLAAALLVAIGWNSTSGSGVVGLVFLIGTWQVAKAVQGKAVEAHKAQGGQLASKWLAFGVGVAVLACLFGAVVLVIYGVENRNQVTIGSKDQVYYSGAATKSDAMALGNALKNIGYFQNRGVTVLLSKEAGGTVISFVTQNGAWNQPGILSSFEQIVWQVAPSVGGFPVLLHLVDSNKDVEKTSIVGKAAFDGGDTIFYEGNATQADAQALGDRFKTIGYFTGKGADVFLTKHDDGTTLAFVVGDNSLDNPETVSDFETIARDVAPTFGGLPIHLELETSTLEVKKDEVIQ